MTTKINNEHKKVYAPNLKDKGNGIRNVPNLRFPEFEGEWEKQKLCDISFIVGRIGFRGYTTNDIVEKGMGAIALSPTNIVNNQLTYDKDNTYISMSKYEESPEIMINRGDVIFVKTGSTVGKVAYVDKLICKTTLNPQVVVLKDIKCDNYILSVIMSTRKFQNKIQRITVGGAVPTLSQVAMGNIFVSLPAAKEQEKISKFISLIDERIATQNKIIDKLQSLIKGIGKQLFMDNQNWRTVKIGELLRIGNGKDYKHLSIGKIPVYGTGGQMLLVNDYLYDGESVCIGRKGTIDTPMFLKGKFWTVDTLFYTYDFKDVLPKFCYYLFLQINWKLYNEGTGVPSLSKSTIENIKVKIPSLEQQQKICSILDCYEHKTNNEEQILELYHSEKQYLLRQMFI